MEHYKTSMSPSRLPDPSMWDDKGRGYPDIAALGGTKNSYCVAVGGQVMGIAGTSAATPVVAGVIAKLNEIRLGRGDKPLGFLNPWLYQAATENPQVFNDVTSGENNGGVFGGGRRVMGFAATEGWDPATGLGTPNFAEMAKIV